MQRIYIYILYRYIRINTVYKYIDYQEIWLSSPLHAADHL